MAADRVATLAIDRNLETLVLDDLNLPYWQLTIYATMAVDYFLPQWQRTKLMRQDVTIHGSRHKIAPMAVDKKLPHLAVDKKLPYLAVNKNSSHLEVDIN